VTGLVVRKIRWEFDDSVPFMWQPSNASFGMFCKVFTFIAVPFDRVRGACQAGLYDRRGGQVGDIQNGARSVSDGHRLPQHAVGQPGHHAHRGAQLPCQQGDLEVLGIIGTCRHHCGGRRDASRRQLIGAVDHGHWRSRGAQFVGNPHRQGVGTAHDGVADHGSRLRNHGVISSAKPTGAADVSSAA